MEILDFCVIDHGEIGDFQIVSKVQLITCAQLRPAFYQNVSNV
jgi:hypothetical protein